MKREPVDSFACVEALAPAWLLRLRMSARELADAEVRDFARCYLQAAAAQKQSDPSEWSAAERAAYDAGDWRAFSRLRGYTEDEIANYGRFMELAGILDARYGEHYSQGLTHALFEASGQRSD